jgi:hypothetical protein
LREEKKEATAIRGRDGLLNGGALRREVEEREYY